MTAKQLAALAIKVWEQLTIGERFLLIVGLFATSLTFYHLVTADERWRLELVLQAGCTALFSWSLSQQKGHKL